MTDNLDPHSPTFIAKAILGQIGINTLMCIGSHEKMVVAPNGTHLGGITFKINPNPKMRLSGRVTIVLNGSDTYNVKIETCRGTVLLNQNNVYAEDLGGPNGIIEGITG